MPAPATLLAVLGTTEIVIIALVVLLLFGGSRLPKLARSLGESITEFKGGLEKGKETPKDPPRIEERSSEK